MPRNTRSRTASKQQQPPKTIEKPEPKKPGKRGRPRKKSNTVHDENGFINGVDLCDCLNESCPGCHFPCPKCRSCKCSVECRVNRKWTIESVENESDVANAQASTSTAGRSKTRTATATVTIPGLDLGGASTSASVSTTATTTTTTATTTTTTIAGMSKPPGNIPGNNNNNNNNFTAKK